MHDEGQTAESRRREILAVIRDHLRLEVSEDTYGCYEEGGGERGYRIALVLTDPESGQAETLGFTNIMVPYG